METQSHMVNYTAVILQTRRKKCGKSLKKKCDAVQIPIKQETHPPLKHVVKIFFNLFGPTKPALTREGAASRSWKQTERRRSIMNKKEETTVCQHDSERHDTRTDVGKRSVIGVLALR